MTDVLNKPRLASVALRSGIRAVSQLWLASLAGAVCAFVTQALLARNLGSTEYGIFAASLASVALIAPLAGFGIGSYWLKVFGEEGNSGVRWLGGSLRFIVCTTGCTVAALLVWALFGPHNEATGWTLAILSLYVPGHLAVGLISSRLQLEEKHLQLSLWQLVPHAARLAILVLTILVFGTIGKSTTVALLYALVAAFTSLAAAPLLRSMLIGRMVLAGHKSVTHRITNAPRPSAWKVAVKAWPFGIGALFHLVYFQSDVILIKYLAGDHQAGLYNVAFIVMSGVYLFPSVLYQKYLIPKMHRWAYHDRATMHYAFKKGNLAMLLAGIVAGCLTIGLAPHIVVQLFGAVYSDAVPMLSLLAMAIPLRFVATNVGAVLVTQENMKKKIASMGSAALLNICLNVLLIPMIGVNGAIMSTIVSEAFLLFGYYMTVSRHVFVSCDSQPPSVTVL